MFINGPGISSYIDHTNLKPASRFADIDQLCREAVQYGFAAVCVPPFVIQQAVRETKGSSVKIATVIGFPLGYAETAVKWEESRRAMEHGADELDVVINLMALKNGLWNYLTAEMFPLVDAIHAKGRIIKVIVESGMLNREEIVRCCNIYGNMGIDYMKTSTGYAEKGASAEDVRLMRQELPAQVGIKASGGIRTYDVARELVEAGATRIGCSGSVALVAQEKEWLTTEKK